MTAMAKKLPLVKKIKQRKYLLVTVIYEEIQKHISNIDSTPLSKVENSCELKFPKEDEAIFIQGLVGTLKLPP